jgi:glycosyltransferase involved in cell wall biosynthesis
MTEVSIIIIARNEERNIARCLESILKASEFINDREIILVDSASTDKTIEIAKAYPIKILLLKNSFLLSPSAGRYAGFLHAKGKYIQFQDGDTELDEGWFRKALPVLKSDDKIAGVTGIITQEEYNTRTAKDWIKHSFPNQKIGEIEYYEGDILLKREVLEEVGPFNPSLKAIEEGELCDRLWYHGYKIVRISQHMSHHYGYDKEVRFIDFLKRKASYTVAQGQVLRASMKNRKIFWKRLKNYKFIVLFSFWITLLPFIALMKMLYLWLLLIFLMFISMLAEMKMRGINHFIGLFTRWPFFIWGFLRFKEDLNKLDIHFIPKGGEKW